MKKSSSNISLRVIVLFTILLVVNEILGYVLAFQSARSEFIQYLLVCNVVISLVLAIIAIVFASRISRSEAKNAEGLRRANLYDQLTGLSNMGHFLGVAHNFYDEMIQANQEPCMLYIDLIGMKTFNMKYGFAEGNKLLQAFADFLKKRFGEERCARFGQDHFIVSTNAEKLDARLDAFIEDCELINGGKSLPVRIGIFLDSYERHTPASISCDRAKEASDVNRSLLTSNYNYYSTEMLAQIELRQYIIDNLDRAIAEGWIHVHYQAIVRASTGKVCDEEALARWVDPERGVIPPNVFIPILEDAQLAYKLDLDVLEQVLKKMRRIADAGLYVVPSSINLSRSDFLACDIVEEVRTRVDASGFDHSKINIEITETVIATNFDFMSKQISRFRDLGFQIWMDDFGSEYSSLDFLQNLHFDLIKFDMRFMQQFEYNGKSKVILTSLIKMALGLGIDTVVEGVETQKQVDFLRAVGCNMLQGYYFIRPIPFETIMERYDTGTAIGFENPDEAQYYTTLGRVNLYDLSSISHDENSAGLEGYFDTLPMAVIEIKNDNFSILRCNEPYLDFIDSMIGTYTVGQSTPLKEIERYGGATFIQSLHECSEGESRLLSDTTLPGGLIVHAFMSRIANNSVTNATAIAIAILSIVKTKM